MESSVLDIRQLQVRFHSDGGTLSVIDEVSLALVAGEQLALLGETGCGKSVLALAILGLLPPNARATGHVSGLGHANLLALPDTTLNGLRGRDMVLIPQNPHGSLNPVFRVGWQLAESLRLNGLRSASQSRSRARDLLARVGFAKPEKVERFFPHQLSGGMAQRVLIAAGLAAAPKVVFADEPTKGLDPSARNRCLDLLRSSFRGSALLLITHDLKAAVCLDRIAVMYGGEIVELCSGSRFLRETRHPYTKGLIRAHPACGMAPIPGSPPSPLRIPEGCRFHPRCPQADERCRAEHPPLEPADSHHWVRCFHAEC